MGSPASERTIVALVGAVQFVNILDFMMVMPLGPDFAQSLGIATSQLGLIGGSYTASAGLSGLACALFLDRFDRRKALAASMLGLVLGTLAGGFARDLNTLMAARILAGFFGGPATSLSFSIIADVIPPERRGKALGAVMGSFSVASVLGVPAGLELARRGSWRTPFFAVALVGLLVTALSIFFLPPMRSHLKTPKSEPEPSFGDLFRNSTVLLSYLMTATVMMASFIVVPNISSYLQFNLGYPREALGLLYLVGGAASFFATRLVGALVDKFGAFRVGSFGTLGFLAVIYCGFYSYSRSIPIMAIFVGFMLSGSTRGVPYNTLVSKVPSARERARFMSIQSAVQHLAAALGAFLSARLLVEAPDHHLEGMPRVAVIAMIFGATFPLLSWLIEARVLRKHPSALPPEPAPESSHAP